jgi:hypothetical protein
MRHCIDLTGFFFLKNLPDVISQLITWLFFVMLLGCQNAMPRDYEKSMRKGIRSGLEISLIRGEESNAISSPKNLCYVMAK